jgi:heat shock protein HslJ
VSFNGCNGGSGTARLEDGRLVVEGGFASTNMACLDGDGEALMDQDAWLAEFLSSGPTVVVDGDTLLLRTDAATVQLVSRGPASDPAAPGDPDAPVSNDPDAPSLPDPGQGSSIPTTAPGGSGPAGGSVGGGSAGSPGAAIWGERWTITSVTSTSGPTGSAAAARPTTDGSAPVLDLTDDGRASFTGCNGGTGSARLDGDRLLVDAVVSTRMACGGPDGEALMAQDAAITAILEAGPTVALDGSALRLTADVGTIEATRAG